MVKLLDLLVDGRVDLGLEDGGAVKIEREVKQASGAHQGEKFMQRRVEVDQIEEGVGYDQIVTPRRLHRPTFVVSSSLSSTYSLVRLRQLLVLTGCFLTGCCAITIAARVPACW